MGTRAIFTFEDNLMDFSDDMKHMAETVDVYKHYDGYPQGAADFLQKALEYAWELPRFEADEFAAAFVAANKTKHGGGIRLTKNADNYVDIEWRYYITFSKAIGDLMVSVYERDWDSSKNELSYHIGDLYFYDRGTFTLQEFVLWATRTGVEWEDND